MHRSDYLLHLPRGQKRPEIRQVEINTISASFGALSSYVGRLHRCVGKCNLIIHTHILMIVDSCLNED
jgi:hypothetical protein